MLRRFGFFVAAVLITAAPANAQDDKKVHVFIGGGYTSVLGPAKDSISAHGGNITFGAIFKVSPMASVSGEYAWNGVPKRQLQLPVYPSLPIVGGGVNQPFFLDGNMQYVDGNVLLHPATSGRAAPYGIVGLGWYHRPIAITTPGVGYATVCDPYWYVCYPTAVGVDKIVGERSSNDFGMNFGGGVNVMLGEHTSFFAEIRYHYVWGPEVPGPIVNPLGATSTVTKANGQFLPITFGFRF